LARTNVLFLILIPIWLVRGKAYVKEQIAKRVSLDVESLPFNRAFVEFLKNQHAGGRVLVLATGSNRKFAHQVAAHLQLFDDVIASDEQNNITGDKKLERLRAAYGDGGFDYAGNSRVDLQIWPHARYAIVVDPERAIEQAVQELGNVQHSFRERRGTISDYLRASHVRLWVWNLLVFLPLAVSNQRGDTALLSSAGLAFLAFCFCASCGNVIDDLVNLQTARRCPRGRAGPLASGKMQIQSGIFLSITLALVAFGLASFLPVPFSVALIVFLGLTIAHSMWFKRMPLPDVLTQAILYTMRVAAGAVAISLAPSVWLLAASMSLFLILVVMKR